MRGASASPHAACPGDPARAARCREREGASRLTTQEALQQATNRWRLVGAIRHSLDGKRRVGVIVDREFLARGEGATWEEAFAQADARREREMAPIARALS